MFLRQFRSPLICILLAATLVAIAEHIRQARTRPTPLQERMDRFARVIGLVVAISAVGTRSAARVAGG